MKLGLYPNWKAKQKIFKYYYKDVHIHTFNSWGEKFCSDVLPKITKLITLTKINEYKKQNAIISIVSASIENWIKPWAKFYSIDSVLCTQIEINEEGFITGKFSSPNCYGQEKVKRLLDYYPDRNGYYLIVFGDSRGDKELMQFANESYYRIK